MSASEYYLISDLFKDANGFRPGSDYINRFNSMPAEEQESEWNYLCKLLEENQAYEARRQADAFVSWEAHIAMIMTVGNVSKGTAIRWDMEAMDVDGDVGYYCWKWDIPYAKETEIKELLR